MNKKKEDEIYFEGKARGFEEGYAKASDHFFKLIVFIVALLVIFYILYRLTGCDWFRV
jgi:hypothetical protein